MQQYLLNLTAIWLVSLFLFDLFLRRESYHTYNRSYLLVTFLLGIVLPAVNLGNNTNYYSQPIQKPLEQVIAVKNNIAALTTTDTTTIGWQQWIWIVYGIGAGVALILLIADVRKLVIYYNKGTITTNNDWVVIETGQEHTPFSLRNLLFVNNIQNYSTAEWQMIVTHEKRHSTLLHIIDLSAMQIARIVFWFHPLIYIYNKRLLLVHEYQADSASVSNAGLYGRFLVEQAVLQAAPVITHSFNRSPIKNRLIMLKHTSTAAAKTKMLLIVPLTVVCTICFTQNSFSQRFEKNGNFVTYKGNKFEMSKSWADSIVVTDPYTGYEKMKITQTGPKPLKMNGRAILIITDQTPYFTGNEKDLRDYLVLNLKNELTTLGDGMYTLNIYDIVVDENGKIVYFDYKDIRRSKTADEVKTNIQQNHPTIIYASDPQITVNINDPKTGVPTPMKLRKNNNPSNYGEIDNTIQATIFKKVCKLMDVAPSFKPAKVNGKAVPSFYECMRFYNHIKVENNKLYDAQLDGTWKEM